MTGRDLMERVGSLIGCAAALFVFLAVFDSAPLLVLLGVVLLATIVFVHQKLVRGERRKRLLSDCEKQHIALMHGHDGYGLYGNFPIPDLDSSQDENPWR